MIDRAVAPDPTSPATRPSRLGRQWSDLLPRLASAIVMIGCALGTAVLGGPAFTLFWGLAAVAVFWEWQHMIGTARSGPRFGVGAVMLAAMAAGVSGGAWLLALAALLAGLVGTIAVAPAGLRAASAAGLVYAAALALAVLVLRRSSPEGLRAILWLFAVVWGTDIMAYFGGRIVGGPKLWPRLSPGKTWSGFLIGVGAGACCGLALAPAGGSRAGLLAVGVAAGALAQGGDLFESGLKRRYGVKDAGHLIPGHGGVMDRLDGFLVAAVFAAGLGAVRMGVDAAGTGVLNW